MVKGNKKSTSKPAKRAVKPDYVSFLFLSGTLFLFWVILSGKFEMKYLTIGLVSAVVIAIITRPLLVIPCEESEVYNCRSVFDLPWFKLAAYFPWLIIQIIVANIQVAMIILHPKLPIDPSIVVFRKKLPNPVAHLTLANSITLTPGTVTVDIDNDKYYVHALSREAAESLVPKQGEGDMPCRVGNIFAGKGCPAAVAVKEKR